MVRVPSHTPQPLALTLHAPGEAVDVDAVRRLEVPRDGRRPQVGAQGCVLQVCNQRGWGEAVGVKAPSSPCRAYVQVTYACVCFKRQAHVCGDTRTDTHTYAPLHQSSKSSLEGAQIFHFWSSSCVVCACVCMYVCGEDGDGEVEDGARAHADTSTHTYGAKRRKTSPLSRRPLHTHMWRTQQTDKASPCDVLRSCP